MLKHVLVPLDGSQLSEQALQYAQDLICSGGKITLLSVVELPVDYDYTLVDIPLTVVTARSYDESDYDKTYNRVRDYLHGKARDFVDDGIVTECVVESGEPATVIADIAARRSVDAIAMTTHGRTGINRWLFGSVTQKVINIMPCPVLVVPDLVREKSEEEAPASVRQVNFGRSAPSTS